ncbi:hypothetical protein BDZ89DRAFT_939320 [Hymenopellis radicata]|nr:hypothetical protein BDZ89DRAFT_1091487 [Hymenopellis radicata]KAF9053965.1 hypothetical protein BDZ89DRAFT_939320 [Hymenopellis radicata]
MARKVQATVDEYPSLWWIVIPPALLISAYFARKWYLARRLRVHGIGKGAPGFQTGVRRVRVTPEIAARIQRGEEVSPEEIAASIARAEQEEANPGSSSPKQAKPTKRSPTPPSEPVNEWLPETVTGSKKQGKKRRK